MKITITVIMMMIMTITGIMMMMTFKVLDSRLEVQPSDTLHWGVGGEVLMMMMTMIFISHHHDQGHCDIVDANR